MSAITRAGRDEMIRQRRRTDLGATGIKRLVNEHPTWLTCAMLHKLHPSRKLGRIMGGLSSAIRVGSEITHKDWGDDWIELSVGCLNNMEPLRTLSNKGEYKKLDIWLEENEAGIVETILQTVRDETEQALCRQCSGLSCKSAPPAIC